MASGRSYANGLESRSGGGKEGQEWQTGKKRPVVCQSWVITGARGGDVQPLWRIPLSKYDHQLTRREKLAMHELFNFQI